MRQKTPAPPRSPRPLARADEPLGSPTWAELLVSLLDDAFRVPGTNLRFGLDPILGLLAPGVGDVLTGVSALSIFVLAFREGVPSVVLYRMAMNVAIDSLLGAVPIVGDLFDFSFRANRRNLALLERHRDTRGHATPGDYLAVAGGVTLALTAIAVPVALAIWLGTSLLHSSFGS